MAKALAVVYGQPYVNQGVGTVSVNYGVAVDDGIHAYQDGFTVNFSLTAAQNITAFKNAVVAGVTRIGGPALATTDVILWGGVS